MQEVSTKYIHNDGQESFAKKRCTKGWIPGLCLDPFLKRFSYLMNSYGSRRVGYERAALRSSMLNLSNLMKIICCCCSLDVRISIEFSSNFPLLFVRTKRTAPRLEATYSFELLG